MSEWTKLIIAGIIGAVATIATGYFGYASKDEELRVRLVENAISILRADPKEGVAPARGWAIEIIEKNSGVAFSKEDRAALLHKPILSNDSWAKIACNGADVTDCLKQILKPSGEASPSPPK